MFIRAPDFLVGPRSADDSRFIGSRKRSCEPGSVSAASLLLSERLSDKSVCHLGLRRRPEEIEDGFEKSCAGYESGCQLLSQMPLQPADNKCCGLGYDPEQPVMDRRFS
jgi:hypothetical protein